MNWQAAPVDDDGTHLAYIDSGPPAASEYKTLVLVHGHTFHAPVFSRLLALAREYNVRIIALNRRDYVNSTRFSDEDLKVLAGNDEDAHENFLRARGLEIARFLCWVIVELKIPQASGLVLIGWSLGNLFTQSFLAHLDTFPREIIETLDPYLTTLFLYAAPYMFLGYPNPPGAYNPFYTENPMRVAPLTFGTWVSSYYTHSAYSEQLPLSSLTSECFSQHIPETQYRTPTTETMSADELATVLDLEPNTRSERFYFDMSTPMLHRMLEKALLCSDNCLLPRMNVKSIYGLEDCWLITWAACEFERDLAKWRAEGEHVRPIELIPIPAANHFVQWDDAETLLDLITKGVRSDPV